MNQKTNMTNYLEKLEGMRKPLRDEPGGTEANIRISEYNQALEDAKPLLEEAVREACQEEQKRLGMGGMVMVANYHGKAVMLAGANADLANQFISEVIDPALNPTQND